MKSIIAGLLLTLALVPTTYSQDKTEFSKIWDSGFNTYQSAENALSNGNKQEALTSFKEALQQFNKIKTATLTSWQGKIISYRIGLCNSNIEAISRSISTGRDIISLNTGDPKLSTTGVSNIEELIALKKQRNSIQENT